MKKKKEKAKQNAKEARDALRKWLVKYTKCDIQEGINGAYPCGTCLIALLGGMGLKPNKKKYHEHNKPIDRSNEVWRAILQIRDAKL